MNAKEGRRLAVLEIDTIFNNLLCIFSNTTSRYIIRRLLRNQYQSRNEQAAALYDIIKTDLGTLTPNGSFSMSMIQKVGTSFNHVGGFQ